MHSNEVTTWRILEIDINMRRDWIAKCCGKSGNRIQVKEVVQRTGMVGELVRLRHKVLHQSKRASIAWPVKLLPQEDWISEPLVLPITFQDCMDHLREAKWEVKNIVK